MHMLGDDVPTHYYCAANPGMVLLKEVFAQNLLNKITF